MCGIAGLWNLKGGPVEPGELKRMIRMIRHRGPDDVGLHIENNVGLAHARLSIIDLAGGHQPMSAEHGALWITFNGEIFNYVEMKKELVRKGVQFSTNSDTEVILQQYRLKGEQCVEDFKGSGPLPSGIPKDESCFYLVIGLVSGRSSSLFPTAVSFSPPR